MNLSPYIDAPTLTWILMLLQVVFTVTCFGTVIHHIDDTNNKLERLIEALMVHHPMAVNAILRDVVDDIRRGRPSVPQERPE